ncbi:MAG: macro domain-containing protein [Myxococcales bacterium]|nr:macro domain-containing protein [Myxococcales bacterium]
MPTVFTKGDLFATDGLSAYAQGCNGAGVMDSGVGGVFKRKWPRMFEEYQLRCSDGRFHLGDVFVWIEGDETIFNLCIQEHWKKKAKLAALVQALRKMIELAPGSGIERIGLPRIGTGLGGLDWPRVKKVLSEMGQETAVTLVVFEQFERAPVS